MNNKTASLIQKDKQFVWHPFTQMQDWEKEDNLIIVEGKGSYLKDSDGKEYLDGVSSLWVNVHGHRKNGIDAAIHKQLKKIAHSTLLGLGSEPSIQLAEQLICIAPQGLKKVFYSDSGSSAVEIAVKMAYQYWQHQGKTKKKKFLHLTNAYHGDTLGAVSVGGIDLFHEIYSPLLFKTEAIPAPYCYRCPLTKWSPEDARLGVSGHLARENPPAKKICHWECVRRLEKALKQSADHVSAVIIEPIMQGAAGMLLAPPGYLKRVRALCHKYDVLMIADEVATGFGRTGKMFACLHEGVVPDIMTIAKGLSGGYLPLAATLTTQKIYNAFKGKHEEKKTFFHGHSYTGNALACAAALANLDVFRKEKVLVRNQRKICWLEKELKRFAALRGVGEVRQAGLMVGIELVKHRKEPYAWHEKIGVEVCREARKRGAILRPLGHVVVLMPPLSISIAELTQLLEITYEAIQVVVQP